MIRFDYSQSLGRPIQTDVKKKYRQTTNNFGRPSDVCRTFANSDQALEFYPKKVEARPDLGPAPVPGTPHRN